jgi:hypothetical protein
MRLFKRKPQPSPVKDWYDEAEFTFIYLGKVYKSPCSHICVPVPAPEPLGLIDARHPEWGYVKYGARYISPVSVRIDGRKYDLSDT